MKRWGLLMVVVAMLAVPAIAAASTFTKKEASDWVKSVDATYCKEEGKVCHGYKFGGCLSDADGLGYTCKTTLFLESVIHPGRTSTCVFWEDVFKYKRTGRIASEQLEERSYCSG